MESGLELHKGHASETGDEERKVARRHFTAGLEWQVQHYVLYSTIMKATNLL